MLPAEHLKYFSVVNMRLIFIKYFCYEVSKDDYSRLFECTIQANYVIIFINYK